MMALVMTGDGVVMSDEASEANVRRRAKPMVCADKQVQRIGGSGRQSIEVAAVKRRRCWRWRW